MTFQHLRGSVVYAYLNMILNIKVETYQTPRKFEETICNGLLPSDVNFASCWLQSCIIDIWNLSH